MIVLLFAINFPKEACSEEYNIRQNFIFLMENTINSWEYNCKQCLCKNIISLQK